MGVLAGIPVDPKNRKVDEVQLGVMVARFVDDRNEGVGLIVLHSGQPQHQLHGPRLASCC